MEKRPVLKMHFTPFQKLIEIFAAAGLLVHIAMLTYYWNKLPRKIPKHFGPAGKPNAWGGRGSLVGLLVFSIAIYVIITIISRFPNIFNYTIEITKKNAEYQYRNAQILINVIKTEVIYIFLYLNWSSIRISFFKAYGTGAMFLPILLIVVFGTLGYYIYRMMKHGI